MSISPEFFVNVSKISYKKNNYMSYKTKLKSIKVKGQKNFNKQVKIEYHELFFFLLKTFQTQIAKPNSIALNPIPTQLITTSTRSE